MLIANNTKPKKKKTTDAETTLGTKPGGEDDDDNTEDAPEHYTEDNGNSEDAEQDGIEIPRMQSRMVSTARTIIAPKENANMNRQSTTTNGCYITSAFEITARI